MHYFAFPPILLLFHFFLFSPPPPRRKTCYVVWYLVVSFNHDRCFPVRLRCTCSVARLRFCSLPSHPLRKSYLVSSSLCKYGTNVLHMEFRIQSSDKPPAFLDQRIEVFLGGLREVRDRESVLVHSFQFRVIFSTWFSIYDYQDNLWLS